MTRLYSRRATINNDNATSSVINMFRETQGYSIEYVFEHIWIQNECIDFFIYIHGATSNRTLPSRVISQQISN
jgi:hypothetical protein